MSIRSALRKSVAWVRSVNGEMSADLYRSTLEKKRRRDLPCGERPFHILARLEVKVRTQTWSTSPLTGQLSSSSAVSAYTSAGLPII